MRLLDLVEQNHRVRAPTHRLSQLTSLFVADIARGRTDESRDGELLAVLAHVDADEGLLVVEQVLGERLREFGFPDAGRAEKHEGAGWLARITDAGARATHRLGDCLHGILLADEALSELRFEGEQPLRLALFELCDGDAGPRSNDRGDVFVGYLVVDHARAELFDLLCLCELLLDLWDDFVVDLRSRLPILIAHRPVTVDLCLVEARLEIADAVQARLLCRPAPLQTVELLLLGIHVFAKFLEALFRSGVFLFLQCELFNAQSIDRTLELIDFDRRAVDLHLEPRRCLVDQVDRLVWKLAGADVAIAEGCGSHQRAVGDRHLMVRLVAALEAAEDRDGVFNRRFADKDLLEPTLECGIFLDVLAVFVERRCSDEPQLTAREHRLEHVGCGNRAFATARAHERVQLVDKGDDLALCLVDLGEHGLEAFFELAAVLGTGNEGSEV